MGYVPHDISVGLPFRLRVMKTKSTKITGTFGEFVTSIYDACDKRNAGKVVQFAVKAHLIEFCGQQRMTIS